MKKLLLILLCLPFIGFGQIKELKLNQDFQKIDFGFELADSRMTCSYYVHYQEPVFIGWSKEGYIAYSYAAPIDQDDELAEYIMIQNIQTNNIAGRYEILYSDKNRMNKRKEIIAKHKIIKSDLNELNKSPYVDEFKIVFDDNILSVNSCSLDYFDRSCQKKIFLDDYSDYIYFSGYFQCPYDNVIVIALISFSTFEEEDYFEVDFYGCDLDINTFYCY